MGGALKRRGNMARADGAAPRLPWTGVTMPGSGGGSPEDRRNLRSRCGEVVMRETSDPAAVRFGPFLFEPINGRLLRAGAELGVPPRALAILACLLERPGLLVTKQHLLDQVWKDAFVTDTSLSEAVSVLRQALGDDAQDPSYVQTVPRRGYRFVASVEPATAAVRTTTDVVAANHVDEALWTPWLPWLACFAAGLTFGVLALALPRGSTVDNAPVTRFAMELPAGHHLAGESSLAVSADGRVIVAVLEDGTGARAAWVRPLDATTFQRVPGSEGARVPFVSADGERVGIVVGDRIRAMAMPSGAWSTVATASLVRGATWLPDGGLIVASGADGALRKVHARGGDPIVLARPRYDLGEAALSSPARVGAMELAFSAVRPGREPIIYAWPAAASTPRPVLSGSAPQWIAPSHLLYRSGDRLHAAAISPTDWTIARTSLLATQGLLTSDDDYAATAGAFVRTTTCRECSAVRVTLDGIDASVAAPGSGVESWQLAQDGQAIVVVSRHGEDRQVWRLGLRDGSTVLLDRGPAFGVATDPEGHRSSVGRFQDGRWEIRSLASSASSRTLVTDVVPLEPSAVSRAGEVWFHKRGVGDSLDVWTVGVDGAARPVVASSANEWDAQPSPDGRYLAWLSDARGDTEAVVRDAQSGEVIGTWPASRIRWTPDGARLLVGTSHRWQALEVSPAATSPLTPTAVPAGLRVPATRQAATELDVTLQWARDVRRQVPVVPRPLPVVR